MRRYLMVKRKAKLQIWIDRCKVETFNSLLHLLVPAYGFFRTIGVSRRELPMESAAASRSARFFSPILHSPITETL